MVEILPKCFTYLQNKGFLQLTLKANRIKELATFGIIVKNNLEKCLYSFNHNVDKFTIFPVASAKSIPNLNNHLLCGRKIDHYGASFSSLSETVNEADDSLKLWSSTRACKNLVILCNPKKSLNLFYSFQNERYRWWRKLSGSPSRFHQSPIEQCKITKEESMSITYRSPLTEEKTLCLENVKYITDETSISKLIGVPLNQHLIWCKIYSDNAAIAYLVDACVQDDNEDIQEMWFHESLAPYHIAITIQSSQDSTINSRLDEIADYLMKDLKQYGITVFPFKHHFLNVNDNCYKWFDGIGIPYTLSLNEESLKLGVIALRSKETKLEETVHISRLKVSLLLYLKLMKPLDIKLAIMESSKASAEKTKSQ